MKKIVLFLSVIIMALIGATATLAQSLSAPSGGPYIVESNSRGIPMDSMYYYQGEWYFDWVYTVPHIRGNFNCPCDTSGGYSGGLFDKYMFAIPDRHTSTAAKDFQKTLIRFLTWDERSNDAKIDWKNEDGKKLEPEKVLEFIKEVYVIRPTWVDSCMADFEYLTVQFQNYEKAGLPRGKIPYDALCLTHLAEYATGDVGFDTLFSIRTYYVVQDISYLQYGYYRNELDSIGLDILKPYLRTREIRIGPISYRDENEEIKVGFIEREIEYIEPADWIVLMPKFKKRFGI